jgi:hypothetical protein
MAEYSEEVAHNKIQSYANEEFVIDIGICLFVCFPGVTPHCGCIFTAR